MSINHIQIYSYFCFLFISGQLFLTALYMYASVLADMVSFVLQYDNTDNKETPTIGSTVNFQWFLKNAWASDYYIKVILFKKILQNSEIWQVWHYSKAMTSSDQRKTFFIHLSSVAVVHTGISKVHSILLLWGLS